MPDPSRDGAGAPESTVALLLDFENAQDVDIHRVLAEAASFGRVIVRRAYADWNRHAAVQGPLRESGFEAVHQFSSGGRGKNSTDIHLAVDAMDILYTRPVDAFVLVTADSDFATLARRLREGGKRVIGMGSRQRAGRALVQSCDQYIYYDLPPPAAAPAPTPKTHAAKTATASRRAGESPQPADITDHHRFVLEAMEAMADTRGQTYGGPLHERIRRLRPDFDYRDYGYSSFLKFVESLKPVLRVGRADDVSDFVVSVNPEYEAAIGSVTGRPGPRTAAAPLLSDDIQERIDDAWRRASHNGRLSGRRAATAVAEMYGVNRLADTPLENLAGVLACAPKLAQRWQQEGPNLLRR
ncbi:MAG: NYN domain-containing protein [Thermoplasmatota archaeon]